MASYQINKSTLAKSANGAASRDLLSKTTTSSKNATASKSSLILSNITFVHSNGETQFENIDFSLPQGLTGLVGDNGAGKSLLADIIRGVVKPTTGQVELAADLLFLGQQAPSSAHRNQTVADVLGATDKLNSLERIGQGGVNEDDFATVGDDWLFAENFATTLRHISDRIHANSLLHDLSGGQRSKVALLSIFERAKASPCLLLLDEPSNHLDRPAKQWLGEQLSLLKSPCLLISHDQSLLELCHHTASLTANGLDLFAGNYHDYIAAQSTQENAKQHQLNKVKSDKKKALAASQRDTEKAQKRASQGANKARQGGQPKVLLGAKKNKAQGAVAAKMAQHNTKLSKLESKHRALQNETNIKPITFAFTEGITKSKQLLYVQNLLSPFIICPITLKIYSGEKWHLCGKNGTGKSTFLHLLHNASKASMPGDTAAQECQKSQKSQVDDPLKLNAKTCLLDQHCSLLLQDKDLLDNLHYYCPHINHSDLRTLLASNGFRKDKVFQQAASLSGGEKMRLAMLIASHQADCLLLLDEPDNHLDIKSKVILADALQRFEGAYLLVSHDADFVAQCGVTNVLELPIHKAVQGHRS